MKAREVIAKELSISQFGDKRGYRNWLETAGDVVATLDAAGFVIVPKFVTARMVAAFSGQVRAHGQSNDDWCDHTEALHTLGLVSLWRVLLAASQPKDGQ